MKVIVVNLHGARLDAFGAYGSSWVTTKHIDQLAAEGVVFDHHYAGSIEFDPESEFCDVEGELRSLLMSRRVPTALFTDERVAGRISLEGWKHLAVVQEEDLAVLGQPTLTDGVFQLAIDWIQQNGAAYPDWFLAVELGTLLPPWREKEYVNPNPEEATAAGEATAPEGPTHADPQFEYEDGDEEDAPIARFGWRNAYAGAVQYFDDLVGQFLTLLRELELDQETLICVTSPCGQSLGERGGAPGRRRGLHEEQVHLPLILRFPRGGGAGQRVHHLTQPADWSVTLLESFGDENPGRIDPLARSLTRYINGQGGRIREYAVSEATLDLPWEASLRTADWSLILPLAADNPRPVQLYRKPEDRWEMNNVAKEHPDVADHLELTLRRFWAWPQESPGSEPPGLREEVVRIVRS